MKEKQPYHIDEVFRKGYEALPEEKYQEADWSKMKQELQKEGLLKRRKKLGYWSIALILLSIGGSVTMGYLFSRHSDLKNESAGIVSVSAPERDHLSNNKIRVNNNKTGRPFKDQLENNKKSHLEHLRINGVEDKPIMTLPAKEINRKKQKKTSKQTLVREIFSTSDARYNYSRHSVREQKTDENRMQNKVQEKYNNTPSTFNTPEEPFLASLPIKKQSTMQVEDMIPETIASPIYINQTEDYAPKSFLSAAFWESNREQEQRKNYYFGIYISKDFNSYELKAKNKDGIEILDNTGYKIKLKGQASLEQYTAGIFAMIKPDRKYAYEVGIYYSQKKKIALDARRVGFGGDSILNNTYRNYEYNLTARYLELSMKFKYYLTTGVYRFYVTPGGIVEFNFPSNSSGANYFKIEESDKNKTVKNKIVLDPLSIGVDITGGIGLERNLGKRWVIYVEPVYRYGLNPLIKRSGFDKVPVEHFLRSWGIGTGIAFSFFTEPSKVCFK